ncbi:MAG: hypothetical protein N0E44_18980 [Candidatus Thiodiazotropha lotti]|nr:hypothetical protein [Candidatus Thiodiazotropha lotti]MCW4221970.1 hypothetical protein [Candidatus Thiodiazotropha lotti]
MMALTPEDLLQPREDLAKEMVSHMKKIGALFHSQLAYPPLLGRAMSMPVFEAPPEPPKIQLSEDVTVSDEFRERMNAWLLERFGRRESVIMSGEALYMKDRGFVMRPETMSVLRMNTTA